MFHDAEIAPAASHAAIPDNQIAFVQWYPVYAMPFTVQFRNPPNSFMPQNHRQMKPWVLAQPHMHIRPTNATG